MGSRIEDTKKNKPCGTARDGKTILEMNSFMRSFNRRLYSEENIIELENIVVESI